MVEIRKKVLIEAREVCENWYEVEIGKSETVRNPEELLDGDATRIEACVDVHERLSAYVRGPNGIRAVVDNHEWASAEVVATNDLRDLSVVCVTYIDSFTPMDRAQETYRYGELGIDEVVDARYDITDDEFGLAVVVELLNGNGTPVALVQMREIENGVAVDVFDKDGSIHPRKIVLEKPTEEDA